jgi:hypothetical protein
MATSTAGPTNVLALAPQLAPASSSTSAWTARRAIYSCILVLDTEHIRIYASQNGVAPTTLQHMLSQLEWVCGVQDAAAYRDLWYLGTFLLGQYPSWTAARQLQYIRDNLETRLRIQAADRSWIDSLNAPPGQNGIVHRDTAIELAIWLRLQSNQQQIDTMRACEVCLQFSVPPPPVCRWPYATHRPFAKV